MRFLRALLSLRLAFIGLFLLFVAVAPVAAFAAVANGAAVDAPDWSAALTTLVNALVVVLVNLAVYGIRLLSPRIPRILLPMIALIAGPVIAAVVGAITQASLVPNVKWWAAVLLGALAVFVREVYNTLSEHGVSGSIPGTLK